MKIVKIFSTFFLLIILSCQTTPTIIGKWKIEDLSPDINSKINDSIRSSIIDDLDFYYSRGVLIGANIEFLGDLSFQISLSDGRLFTGKYNLTENEKIAWETLDKKRKGEGKFLKLDNNRMWMHLKSSLVRDSTLVYKLKKIE